MQRSELHIVLYPIQLKLESYVNENLVYFENYTTFKNQKIIAPSIGFNVL